MCVKVNSQGKLTITHQCQLFCINGQNRMMHVISRQCVALQATSGSGGDVLVTATCNFNSVFVEIVGYGVKHIKSGWYMHPTAYHSQPPPGILVVLWYAGYHPFYFDYENNFF